MRLKLLMICIMTIFGLSACSGEEQSSKNDEEHVNHKEKVAGDIREETKSVDVLPSFLEEKPVEMQWVYSVAAQHQELLEQIPCYCGCGDSVNHKNSYDCFVNENKEDGAIVWDEHGTKCGVCLEIASQSVIDYKDGKTVEEIRTTIDNKYKEGYANPTPTPEI